MRRAILTFLFAFTCWTQALAGVNCTLPVILQNNTLADANQVMANFNSIIACLLNAAGAGQNNDITALNALSTPLTPSQGGSPVYLGGAASGSGNSPIVATTIPTGFTLTTGYSVIYQTTNPNTGAVQINVNNTGATNLYRRTPSGTQAMTGGELIAGNLNLITYDGTQWQLMNSAAATGGVGANQTLVAAASTDLGTVPSHYVGILAGASAITDFGASASTTYPVYLVTFSTSTTITYNATNCGTVGGCLFTPGASNIQTQSGDTMWIAYLGTGSSAPAKGNWQIISYQKFNGAAVVTPTPLCGFSGLQWVTASSTNVNISWKSASLTSAAGVGIYSGSQSKTLNISTGTSTPTVNGMDGEVAGANQFVYMYGISTGSAFDTIGSLNSSAPVMPTGYVYYCLLGSIKVFTTSSSLYGVIGRGALVRYLVGGTGGLPPIGAYPLVFSGPQSLMPVTVQGLSATAFISPTATEGTFILANAGGVSSIGPGNAMCGGASASVIMQMTTAMGSAQLPYSQLMDGTGLVCYAAGNGSAELLALGYRDGVNAN